MRNILRCTFIGMSTILFLILMLLACGCQPTPEKTAVVYGGGLEEKLEGSPAPTGTYDAPASWQETLNMKGSDTKVEIYASISVPEVTAFPVYKVKQTEFNDSLIKPLVDYFAKGKDVIKTKEQTKDELEQALILAQKDNDEEWAAYLEEMIETAPEAVPDEIITDWDPTLLPSGSFLAEDGEYAGIWVSPDTFFCMKGHVITESTLLLNDKDEVGDVAISSEDAVAAAQNMLQELGIDYMAADSLEKAQRYASVENAFAEPGQETFSKGYLIKFARILDGITGITGHAVGVYGKEEIHYNAPLYPEEVQLYVDEAGETQSFVWLHPLEIEEKVTENIALLPFEDIKQRIRDMLTFINFNDSLPVQVTNIDLNMAIVDVKDHPGEAMYVPAWFIYYTQTFYDQETGEKEQQKLRLGLNAIDGGRVLELPVDISPEFQAQMDKDR